MGQYYNAVLKNANGEMHSYYNYGLKLMEHSWFKNPFVNEVCKKLINKPHNVAWVGDYADNDSEMVDFSINNCGEQIANKEGFNTLLFVLVNHTKKQYMTMDSYYNNAIRKFEDDWVIHPLPLLTAKGNGRGGGDYRGANLENVGIWAEDLLEFVTYEEMEYDYEAKTMVLKEHKDYKEVTFEFYE